MSFCLPKITATKLIQAIKDGKFSPDTYAELKSTEARREYLTKFVGEDAKEVNTQMEAKLLLKDWKKGMVTAIKKVTGLSESAKSDLVSRVTKMKDLLSPADESKFYADITAKRLGTEVTFEEARKIAELGQKVQETKANQATDRLAYGRAKVELGNYVSDLKNSNAPSLVEKLKSPGGLLNELAGTSKGLKASLDNSAIFRQGWKTLFSHPTIWLKNARTSFSDLARQFGGKAVMDEVQADIQSRPTYDLMQRAGLDTGTTEEQFPSHLAEKIPLVGRAYKASEAAYTGFVYRMRADVFDKYLKIAETAGVDITDEIQLKSIGKLVNSLTGRGYLGAVGEKAASAVNNIFFSPRFLKSNLDFLTAHQLQKDVTPFVRKQAAINLVKVIAGSASVLAIANAVMPGSVETDPRSSNFGKIRVNGTTYDVSGGMGSVLVLAAKLATLSSKSSTTNKVTPLNSGKYGAQTGADVLVNFGEGKLSPIAGIVRDILKGQDYNSNKPTFLNELNNFLTPLPITNTIQLYQDPKNAHPLIGVIADALGISVNPANPPKKK